MCLLSFIKILFLKILQFLIVVKNMESTFATSSNVCENIECLCLLWDNGCLPIGEKIT